MILDFKKIHSIQTLGQYIGYSETAINKFIEDESSRQIEIITLNQNGKERLVVETSSISYSNILKALKEYLIMQYHPAYSVTGYVKGRNISDNAIIHLNQRFILKADIKEFFYSIKCDSVVSCFEKLGIDKCLAEPLSNLVTFQGILYPGLCTSPILSNIILIDMDSDFFELTKKKKCKYSRYADDITFSSDSECNLPSKNDVEQIFQKYGFTLNEKKFSISKKGQKQVVTGLSIADKTCPRIPRKIKVKIKTACLLRSKLTYADYSKKVTWCSPEHLEGLLHFYKTIEPNFVKKMHKLKNSK